MKKIIIACFLLGMSFCVFAQSGVIRELSGTVEIKNAGASDFVPASAGAVVSQNTIISTGFKSMALVEVGSTIISVRPLTRLTLTEIRASQGQETLNVNLAAGRVRVDVNPPAGTRASMAVVGPSATASCRGTGFEFDTRNVSVHQGVVDFNGNSGYVVQVGAGSFTGVTPYDKTAGPQYGSNMNPQAPYGYDPASASTGGGGVASEGEPEPPPKPPSGDTPNTGGGGGGPPPVTPTGTITIGATF